jgi:transcriptional regulator with XRE-family HTH domain
MAYNLTRCIQYSPYTFEEALGYAIRVIREEHDFSQSTLASQINFSVRAVSDRETAKVNLTFDYVFALCEACNIPFSTYVQTLCEVCEKFSITPPTRILP